MQHFNPIQSEWVVAIQKTSIWLLKHSIPFGVAILNIMVQNVKFSLALKARKSSSLHTILC